MGLFDNEVIRYIQRKGISSLICLLVKKPKLIFDLKGSKQYSSYDGDLNYSCNEAMCVINRIMPILNLPLYELDEIKKIFENIGEGSGFKKYIIDKFITTKYRPHYLVDSWRVILYLIIRKIEPEKVLETGVYDGLSSMYVLRALLDNKTGGLTSIDLDKDNLVPIDNKNYRSGWLVPKKFHKIWDFQIGDVKQNLDRLFHECDPDLVISDTGNKQIKEFEVTTIVNNLKPGAVAIIAGGNYLRDLINKVASDIVICEFKKTHSAKLFVLHVRI
jgi:hypothetical protein